MKSYLLTSLLVALLVCPPPLLAAVIVVDGSCTLVDAITAANTDMATGGCPAGSEADEILLTVDVSLTTINNTTDGPPMEGSSRPLNCSRLSRICSPVSRTRFMRHRRRLSGSTAAAAGLCAVLWR